MSSMGNSEAVSQHKLMISADKGLPTDDNTTVRHCDASSQNSASVNNEIETTKELEKTTSSETTALTSGNNLITSSSTPMAFENSSSESGQDQRHMWDEVALRYQQILHREYRMLNLPTYPVQGGNFYLYYVPVIVNQGYLPQNYDSQVERNNGAAADQKTGKTEEEVIYIDDSDDDCDSNVKEEPLQSSCGRNIKVESKEGKLPNDTVSCKVEKNRLYNGTLPPKWDETTKKEGKRFDDYAEHKKHTENSTSGRRDGSSAGDDDESIQGHCDNYSIEVKEDFIRIFKGYTIEYHPLHRDNTVNQRTRLPATQQCSVRDEKIQDLKKRVAEHRGELEKLKIQQSVAAKGCANGVSHQLTNKYLNGEVQVNEYWKENNKASFAGPRARELLKDCPSAQIHYFPSGERKTFFPRRRKQTLPRRIDALSNVKTEGGTLDDVQIVQPERSVNFEVNDNSAVNRKRKLTPSPEILIMGEKVSAKHVPPSKKSKVQRKRKKAQHMSQSPNSKKESNSSKATMPQDISQEEFLSVFGLLKVNGQLHA